MLTLNPTSSPHSALHQKNWEQQANPAPRTLEVRTSGLLNLDLFFHLGPYLYHLRHCLLSLGPMHSRIPWQFPVPPGLVFSLLLRTAHMDQDHAHTWLANRVSAGPLVLGHCTYSGQRAIHPAHPSGNASPTALHFCIGSALTTPVPLSAPRLWALIWTVAREAMHSAQLSANNSAAILMSHKDSSWGSTCQWYEWPHWAQKSPGPCHYYCLLW